MSRFGFCSGSYNLPNVNANCQICRNWYPQVDESQEGKSAMILEPSPGLAAFSGSNAYAQCRGLWTINGRTFAVLDKVPYEILSNGNLSNPSLGAVLNDGQMLSMVASPQQLLICSGGQLYVYFLQQQTINGVGYNAGQFITVPASTFPGPVTKVGYVDGFFLALIAGSQQYWVSNSLDATNWNNNGAKILSVYADNVVTMGVDHREAWFFGARQSEVEYDSGGTSANPFPFSTVNGGFVEQGCGAAGSVVNLDNGLFLLGARNDQGWAIAWRTNGYSFQRVSNHAVESAWSTYPTISDARAFTFLVNGHAMWQINFPTANASWRYDVATGFWHEVSYWNGVTAKHLMHRAQCATFNFGKLLVGDNQTGLIYQMAPPVSNGAGGWNFVTDAGNPIIRQRRAPHISTEQEWIRHSQLQVDFETGVGPEPPLLDGAGKPRGPIATMRYSDDGGHTWSMGRNESLGLAGEYKKRVIYRRLGRSRDRVYEITCADPVPYRVVDAYLKAKPGFEPQERLPKQYGKVA